MFLKAINSRFTLNQWPYRTKPPIPNSHYQWRQTPISRHYKTSLINLTLHHYNTQGRSHTSWGNEMAKNGRQYWLLKTEPGEWSWDDQAANGGVTKWDGVKNKQAQKHLKSMKLGDLCFFYHSGARARRVVGVVSVIKEWYGDGGGESGEVAVDVKEVGMMRTAVDLKEMKRDDGLKGWALFRQPRLSVVPVSESVWERLCDLGGGFDGDGREQD